MIFIKLAYKLIIIKIMFLIYNRFDYLNPEKNEFILKVKQLLYKIERVNGRDEKIKVVFEIMSVLDKYKHIWKKFDKFPEIVKKKFIEFSYEKELEKECKFFLEKHFVSKCQAYTKWGIRCKNRVKSEVKGKFCKVHVNFYPNILSTLENLMPRDIANICLKFIFTYD